MSTIWNFHFGLVPFFKPWTSVFEVTGIFEVLIARVMDNLSHNTAHKLMLYTSVGDRYEALLLECDRYEGHGIIVCP